MITNQQIMQCAKKAVNGMVVLLFLIVPLLVQSQNTYRFSQYMFNELSVNPAYAGTKNGFNANLIYRTQWLNIEGQPTTQIVSLQTPVRNKKIGLGALLYKEDIGIQSDLGIYFSYSYQIRFPNSHLAFGINAGLIDKQINWNEIRTASEVNTGEIDPAFPEERVDFWMPNFGFGTYFYSEQFYIGLSAPRILDNEMPVDNDVADLFALTTAQIHVFFTSGYVFHLKNGIVLKPSIMLKRVKQAPNQLDVNLNCFLLNGLNFGAGLHLKDSYVLMLGYNLGENLVLSYSFDLTSTNLSYYNPTTHEIVLSYMVHSKSDRIMSPRYF